jgi:hypothetical protein
MYFDIRLIVDILSVSSFRRLNWHGKKQWLINQTVKIYVGTQNISRKE